jgi:uncharacterized membrane protein YkoI
MAYLLLFYEKKCKEVNMETKKTLLGVFILALIAATLIGVTALNSGNNLSSKQIGIKDNSDKEDIIPSDFSAKITLEQAQAIALSNVVGSTLKEGQLEDEDGNIVYNIDVIKDNAEFEVKINPDDGSVIKIESDNEDDKESAETDSEDNSDSEQDGINHEFEGEEENED